ncbi:hypothetical protein CPB86DRAFT_592262 [Serendipita vermifera]|nr:hypothetical protein CPB86DRAFT_592262 [Serendipita vermifera]
MQAADNEELRLETMIDEMRESEYLQSLLRQSLNALKVHKQSISPDGVDLGNMAAVAEYNRSLNSGKLNVKLEKLKYKEKWTKFREIIGRMEGAELRHDKAHSEVQSTLDSGAFWSSVDLFTNWLDLQLPPEDIEYRRAVSELNRVRDEAFNFYVANQQALIAEHKERMSVLRSMAPASTNQSSQRSFSRPVQQSFEQDMPSPPFSPVSEPDIGSLSVRGPFSPVPYINYLNGQSYGTPVYGTALDSKSGTLIRQITEHTSDYLSSPHPIFVLPNSGGAGISYCLRRAFHIEKKWGSYNRALEEIIRPTDESQPVDKGWLLGLLLVNLPHPILWISDKNVEHFKHGVPSDSIKYLLQRHSLPQNHSHEYHYLKSLWRHTDDENVREGAVAITQRPHTEKILSDIRCKWNMDMDKTVPAYHRRRSSDESSRTRLSPINWRRRTGTKDHVAQSVPTTKNVDFF